MSEKKVPLSVWALGALGLACLTRGIWRPYRVPMGDSRIVSCENLSGCDNTLSLGSSVGTSSVYAVAPGNLQVIGKRLVLIPSNEAVAITYDLSDDATPLVNNQQVGIGQKIALASSVKFSVFRINQDKTLTPLVSSAWLVAHGFDIATEGGSGWCSGGRRMIVPTMASDCKIRLPEPPTVSLLPVSIQNA